MEFRMVDTKTGKVITEGEALKIIFGVDLALNFDKDSTNIIEHKYYTKCLKCNYEVKTMSQFDEGCKSGEWFIGGDGNTWDWEHDCSKKGRK